MAYHGLLIPSAIAASNVDSFNRSVSVAANAVDNGDIVTITGVSAVAGEGEVFAAETPTTGNLTGCWMIYSGDEVVLTDSRYKGLDPDPRNFFTLQAKVVSAFKPQLGDIVLMSAECFTGARSSNTFGNATNAQTKLVWGGSQTGSVLSYKYLETTYVSLGTGAIDNQRVAMYRMECVGL
jgi:hypothetical protein